MPTEIYIAVLVASTSVFILTVLVVAGAIYLSAKLSWVEKTIIEIRGDLTALIKESREALVEIRQATVLATKPIDDVNHITHTARAWTDRVDRLMDAVAIIAEPPIYFLSRKATLSGKIALAVLQALRNPKPKYSE